MDIAGGQFTATDINFQAGFAHLINRFAQRMLHARQRIVQAPQLIIARQRQRLGQIARRNLLKMDDRVV